MTYEEKYGEQYADMVRKCDELITSLGGEPPEMEEASETEEKAELSKWMQQKYGCDPELRDPELDKAFGVEAPPTYTSVEQLIDKAFGASDADLDLDEDAMLDRAFGVGEYEGSTESVSNSFKFLSQAGSVPKQSYTPISATA